MGWLRVLMDECQPPVRSLGVLARSALRDPAWPKDLVLQSRSLAAVFSKLDRGVDLDWLAERLAVQEVLARLLGCQLGEVQSHLPRAGAAEDGRIRLYDLPYARAVDLRTDRPVPGLPASVLQPSCWAPCWWLAPSGSGRTLAGLFLAARGHARVVDCLDSAVPASVPVDGPLFIELHEPVTWLGELARSSVPLCIAAPFLPEDTGLEPRRFARIDSPLMTDKLRDIVDWAAERLGSGGRLEPRSGLQWLLGEAVPLGLVDTVGSTLGLCGLIDEFGVEELRGKSIAQLVRKFVQLRLERVQARRPDAAWFKHAHRDALGLLADHWLELGELWDQPRSLDQWLGLIPEEMRRGADVEWLRVSLGRVEPAIRMRDIERAARSLPPGAFQLVRLLEELGLLRRLKHNADFWAPGPRWLWLGLFEQARHRLVRASPLAWGEALIRPRTAPSVASALRARARSDGPALVEDLLEFGACEEPGYGAAVEAVFVRAGLGLLEGQELAADAAKDLMLEQLQLTLELTGQLPRPRFGLRWEPGDAEERHGVWLLAALALSEQVETPEALGDSLLCPWAAACPAPGWRDLQNRIHRAMGLAYSRAERWPLAAYALFDRLRSTLGDEGLEGKNTHPLDRPGKVLDEIVHGVLEWESVAPLADDVMGLDALAALAEVRKVAWDEVAQAMWQVWKDQGYPESPLFDAHHPRADLLWKPLLAEQIAEVLAEPGRAAPYYAAFRQEHWQSFVSELSRLDPARLGDVAAWKHLPETYLSRVLAEVGLPPVALEQLWLRFPEALAAEVERRSRGGEASGVDLALVAPAEHTELVLDVLDPESILNLPPEPMQRMRGWLHGCVERLVPGWRKAYALLDAVEQRVRSAGR
ncbi:MAG: hypothetical protein JW940_08185 [Polyangiaceae bacterium]|nr:hypothetical protein [Polyangiaceae bacterium]